MQKDTSNFFSECIRYKFKVLQLKENVRAREMAQQLK